MTISQETKDYVRDLFLTDFDKAVQVTGIDLQQLELCKKRKANKSFRQIAQSTGINHKTVFDRCKKCP